MTWKKIIVDYRCYCLMYNTLKTSFIKLKSFIASCCLFFSFAYCKKKLCNSFHDFYHECETPLENLLFAMTREKYKSYIFDIQDIKTQTQVGVGEEVLIAVDDLLFVSLCTMIIHGYLLSLTVMTVTLILFFLSFSCSLTIRIY